LVVRGTYYHHAAHRTTRRFYGSLVEAPLVSCGLPHVLPPGSLRAALLRVRLGSTSAARCLPSPFTSPSSRGEALGRLCGRNAAHSDWTRRHQEAAPVGFFPISPRRACTCCWLKKRSKREWLVRLGLDERNVAEPMAAWLCCSSAASSVPHNPAIPNCSEWVHRTSTRLSMRSWPTSCSSSSTSGRRSTSRRPALTPRWTPERARLPRTPCLAADRVTVACAYVRSTVATALGRSHAVGAAESGQ
jgi:hypothetical protein